LFCATCSTYAVGGDFNGDGIEDLAIGAPLENINTIVDTGVVHIIYGTSASGLASTDAQAFSQNTSGVLDVCEANDLFGSAIAAGDFDNDGFDDLAIGVPGETVGGQAGAGAIQILYGSASGLTTTGMRQFTQATTDVESNADANDNFGASLAVGDVNNDGFDDLAVGVPGETVGGQAEAGAVHVFFGTSAGLRASTDAFRHQNSVNILDSAEPNDRFGSAVAFGDFDADGFDDLVVGVHLENITNHIDAGAIQVMYGSASGLTTTDQFWHQNSAGIADISETGDQFGQSIVSGDFDGDGFSDLAIGVAHESLGSADDCGAVSVLYGSANRLRSTGSQFWHQNSPGITNIAADNENFGTSLAAGDFDNDGFDDLAIGVPGQIVGGIENAGAVHVLYGNSTNLAASGSQLWSQDSSGVLETAEASENFGGALLAADFDGDGNLDLAIGVPGEAILSRGASGGVNVLYGTTDNGLTSIGDQFWSQNSSGIVDTVEVNDQFGAAVGG